MDRKAIVQGLYKKLKIREIATLSKCGLATVQRTKDYLQDIPIEEAIELTESQLQALFDQPHRKPDVFVEEDFADVFRKVNRVKLRMTLKDCWYQYKKSHEQSCLEVMGYKTYCKRYGEFKEKLDDEAKFQECGRCQWLPGQAVMVDYSEDGLPALIGGVHVELQVFVAVLPYSGYTFAYATPNQTRKSWLHSIREMMTELQGATKYIILETAPHVSARQAKSGQNTQKNLNMYVVITECSLMLGNRMFRCQNLMWNEPSGLFRKKFSRSSLTKGLPHQLKRPTSV